jgi:histidine triad (HIT) family protein
MTLFSKIIAGEIPGEFIFKDQRWVAFLDIFPAAPGHCLLVPREPVAFLSELSGGSSSSMGLYIRALSNSVKLAAQAPAVSVLIRDGSEAGQEIPHVHIHFIPRHDHEQAHAFSAQPYADSDEEVQAQLTHWGTAIRRHWSGI